MAEVGPVGLDEVAGVLSERLRFLRDEPPLRRYGHVFVSGIDDGELAEMLMRRHIQGAWNSISEMIDKEEQSA